MRQLAILLPLLVLLGACDLSKDDRDTVTSPAPDPTVLVALTLRSLGDGHTVEAIVSPYGGSAPYLLSVSWGDGAVDSAQGADLRVSHAYEGCSGPDDTGWPVTATVTEIDSRESATATGTAQPCL